MKNFIYCAFIWCFLLTFFVDGNAIFKRCREEGEEVEQFEGTTLTSFDEDEEPIMMIVTPSILPSITTKNDSHCFDIGNECTDSGQCCSNACWSYLGFSMCVVKPVPTSKPKHSGLCRVTGTRCFDNWECCTVRCQ